MLDHTHEVATVENVDTDDDTARVANYYEGSALSYAIWSLSWKTSSLHYGHWDDQTRSHRHSFIRANEVMVAPLGLRPGMRVLDMGCGCGGTVIWAAQTFGCHAVGISLSPFQIRHAQRVARLAGVADLVDFYAMDYGGSELESETFDAIYAQQSLCHARNKAAPYREAARLLKPGGLFVEQAWIRYRRDLSPDDEHKLLFPLNTINIPDLPTVTEIDTYATAAGMVQVQPFEDIHGNVERSLRRMRRLAYLTRPITYLVGKLGLGGEAELENARAVLPLWEAYRAGLWSIGHCLYRKPAA